MCRSQCHTHNGRYFPVVCLLGLALVSCIEEVAVDFPTDYLLTQLVVDAQINDGPGPYFVELKQAAFLGRGDTAFRPVDGAQVDVLTASGERFGYEDLGRGTYRLDHPDFQGTIGESYTLEVTIGETLYRSAPELLPEPVAPDGIHWQQIEKEFLTEENRLVDRPYVEIYIDTPVPERTVGPFLRWQTLETYSLVENPPPPPGSFSYTCYFTFPTNLQRILLFDGETFTGDRWENQWVGDREIDWTFATKHVFSVTQISMSEGAYQYWEKVQQVIEQVGSIFDAPPAAIGGNMRNVNDPTEIVLGYFEAVAIDTLRIFTVKSDFDPRLAQPRCVNLGVFDPRQPPECNNCRLLEGASIERPYFY